MSITPIRADTVLPARRTPVTLRTADGLALVGELATPADRDPVATLVCLHPLPTHGGTMDSHLYRKAAWRLPALAAVAVLRFNTRGTASAQGASQGVFDNGRAEQHDVAAALNYAAAHRLPRVWVAGWSFGTDLALRYGLHPVVEGVILLSPTLHRVGTGHLDAWAAAGRPVIALVPEHDDHLRPDAARDRFARIPQAEVAGVAGARHLWVGDAERALDEIVARLVPGVAQLPSTYAGPVTSRSGPPYPEVGA